MTRQTKAKEGDTMAKINPDGSLELTRGNSFDVILSPYTDNGDSPGEPIVPVEGDELIFTIGYGERAVIRKTLTVNDYDPEQEGFLLSLTAEETDIPPYKYSYDCLYCFADGRTATFPDGSGITFEITRCMSRKTVDSDG